MDDLQKGFAPIVIILAVVILLGVGAGGFVLVSKNKTSSPPPASSQTETSPAPTPFPSTQTPETKKLPQAPAPPTLQAPKTETLSLAVANPKELLGWWEEEGGFGFLKEFTDQYYCTQYSSRSTCVNNVQYRIEGDRIFLDLEWLSGLYGHPYAVWKMVGDKLELTSADSPRKTLYKKIGPPTSNGKITAPKP